ncbi:hypothetical protein Pyn_07350 [Prunus yedoensis var. nudiflora]|uniref:Uncharacterized protein n=1 Tax=Prunus yedoensis var. nudiflora TaxID=2094558 RepID=A0A314ZQ35_PRUYE|nr:hypothetical protein Pyn_07350 [Prunus yedoensis var. nudiflora]
MEVEGQIGNNDVAIAASTKRLLPHEHTPLKQNESGASDLAVEASELTRVGEESERDVIRPRGAMWMRREWCEGSSLQRPVVCVFFSGRCHVMELLCVSWPTTA